MNTFSDKSKPKFDESPAIYCRSLSKLHVTVWLRRGYSGSEPELRHRIWPLSQMPAYMNDKSPWSPWSILLENGFHFGLVAMVTTLGLWLVKHGNKRNSKTNYCRTFKISMVVHLMNAHKIMKPDFLFGCHGNQEPTNQDIFKRNSNLKIDIKNPASWFCSSYLA